jgi:hypothetical protein
MDITRLDLQTSAADLLRSSSVEERAIGENFAIEENVGPNRRAHFEGETTREAELREAAEAYFRDTVQGMARGHPSSTFDPTLNAEALLPATVEGNQKIIRLEKIDGLIAAEPDLDFDRLQGAIGGRSGGRDLDVLAQFVDLFRTYPGERPAFVTWKSEVEADLKAADWLDRLIGRLGLLHHFHGPGKFALMEYLAQDVIDTAANRGVARPFALGTVLECRNNPAFFPAPRGGRTGFAVGLDADAARELLHMRIDYLPTHVVKLGQRTGPKPVPDLAAARLRHAGWVRTVANRPDFGSGVI